MSYYDFLWNSIFTFIEENGLCDTAEEIVKAKVMNEFGGEPFALAVYNEIAGK